MQLHSLRSTTKLRASRRVGRGGKRGKTSGRGTKGQGARAGAKIRPALRDIIKKIPKRRGYRFHSFAARPEIISLGDLEHAFEKGSMISPKSLVERGLLKKDSGRLPRVKILSSPTFTRALSFQGVLLSKKARAQILEAGGTIK